MISEAQIQPGAETAEPVATAAAEGQQPAAAQEGAAPAAADGEKPAEQAAAPAVTAPTPHELDWVKENPLAQKTLEAVKAGDLKGFLQAISADYDTMPAEDLFRIKMKEENPGVSDSTIEKMLKRDMAKYDLGKFDDDAGEAAKELMEQDAKKIREGLKERQAAYAPPKAEANAAGQQQSQEQAALIQETTNYLTNHPDLKAFETNRNLKLGVGEEAINFKAADTLTQSNLLDQDTLWGQFWSDGPDGKRAFDMAKYAKVLNYAHQMDAVETALINHGKTLGSKAEFTARHNPGERPVGSVPGSGEGSGIKWGFK